MFILSNSTSTPTQRRSGIQRQKADASVDCGLFFFTDPFLNVQRIDT